MIVYPYLRSFGDLARAVIMDVVIPGVPPWQEVVRNPYIWHLAFHSVPRLPELLVQGHQREYFDFFYDVLSADPAAITPAGATGTPGRTPPTARSRPVSAGTARSPGTPRTTGTPPGR